MHDKRTTCNCGIHFNSRVQICLFLLYAEQQCCRLSLENLKCSWQFKMNWDSVKMKQNGAVKYKRPSSFRLLHQILHKVSLTDPSREKTLKILAVIRDKSLLSQSSLPSRTHHLSPMYLSAAMLLAALSWQYLSTTAAQAQGAGEGQ